MSQDDAIKILTDNLEETIDVTKNFAKALQDEMVVNAGFRGQVTQEILNLHKSIDSVKEVLMGKFLNGEPIIVRFSKIDQQLTHLDEQIKDLQHHMTQFSLEERERRIRVTERFWNFLLQNSPILLTWTGLAIWFVLEYVLKIPLTSGGK